jgi:hypothetical protein
VDWQFFLNILRNSVENIDAIQILLVSLMAYHQMPLLMNHRLP